MESFHGSVEARLIGRVNRVEHAAKPVVERVFEAQGVPQHTIGRLPLLVKKQRVELRDGARELLVLGFAQRDWIRRQDIVEFSEVMRVPVRSRTCSGVNTSVIPFASRSAGTIKSRPPFTSLTACWYSSNTQVVLPVRALIMSADSSVSSKR